MRFGIFSEQQISRPWHEGGEEQPLRDALEQIEIADRVGFDVVWEVEHHFLEEYSHSSAPEVFLAAASQRTKRIRLGHGIVQLPTSSIIRCASPSASPPSILSPAAASNSAAAKEVRKPSSAASV